jgi:flagellar basal-body rod protein FlgF
MDRLLISAASGMKARMESLDMLANNIANSGTTGFKADKEFYNLYKSELPVIEKQWTDFSQGSLVPTGNPLNLALEGTGFFALNSPRGVVYARSGDFQISRANQLQSVDGYTLRNVRRDGRPITVDPTKPIDVDGAGVIRQADQEIAQIEIAGFERPAEALGKLGSSYFAQVNPAGLTSGRADALVRQGALEQSNVPAADASVRLVSVMRQFEMLQRAMTLGAEMNKRAIDEVARVS